MKESELVKLLVVINKCYGYFTFDDPLKTQLWFKLLKDVPFGLAESNLERYLLNPDSKNPPHPGILAATPTQQIGGPDIPNVEETMLMLEKRNQLLLQSGDRPPIPESVREAMRLIGTKSPTS